MSHNSFGHIFRVTSWGESHGPSIGCVLDGTPPGIALQESDIQCFLDKRRPGQSRFTTQRRESDQVEILSGVFQGETTGAPISLKIDNIDTRSKDYDSIKDSFRPGHADYSWWKKYGRHDWRGGGRSSARETATRVAAGAVARLILGKEISIYGALIQMGTSAIDGDKRDWEETNNNPFFCPNADIAKQWESILDDARKSCDSLGAVIEIRASGVPVGLGAPIYGKLDAELAAAMMGINATKAVEIGSGFAMAKMKGSQAIDRMRPGKTKDSVKFLSNHAGGILGGVSTGQEIIVRFAVKPTSSISQPVETITKNGEAHILTTKGRHDPCVGIRAVPVGEAMIACVLADHKLYHQGQCHV